MFTSKFLQGFMVIALVAGSMSAAALFIGTSWTASSKVAVLVLQVHLTLGRLSKRMTSIQPNSKLCVGYL